MEMKFYSPLTAEFFPDEPDWEDESYNEYEGYPMDGHDLLQYADAVDEAVKKDIADFNGDLMQYYHEDDSVRSKVVNAVPSVEIHGNKLCGCLNVELQESLNEGEQAVLCDYISGQYSDGWGEGFEQRDAILADSAVARDSAYVGNNAVIADHAVVQDNAIVCGGYISGNSCICGSAILNSDEQTRCAPMIGGNARVYGELTGNVVCQGGAVVLPGVKLYNTTADCFVLKDDTVSVVPAQRPEVTTSKETKHHENER